MERDLIREFVSYLSAERGLSENTLAAYRRDLGKLKEFADSEGLGLGEINRSDLRGFIADMSQQGLSVTSINRCVSAIRGFYRFLQIDKFVIGTCLLVVCQTLLTGGQVVVQRTL